MYVIAVPTGDESATTFAVLVAGNDTPLTVTAVGTDVVVNSATNGAGAVTTTAAEMIAAIAALPAAAALVVVTLQTGEDGTGVIDAQSETALSSIIDGTTPTMTVTVEHSIDGSTWFSSGAYAEMTTVIAAFARAFSPLGTQVRYDLDLGGTLPVYPLSVAVDAKRNR